MKLDKRPKILYIISALGLVLGYLVVSRLAAFEDRGRRKEQLDAVQETDAAIDRIAGDSPRQP